MLHELIQSKDYSLLIFAFLIFLSFFFLIRAILMFLTDPQRHHQRRLKQRLREIDGLETTPNVATLLKKSTLKKSVMDENLDKFRLTIHLQSLMVRANLTWKMSTFLVVAALFGLVGLVAGMGKFGVIGGLIGCGVGLFIPYNFLVRKGKKRLKKFERQLPEALDLLARGLKAGHAFPSGLQQVAKEMPDPLGTEFSIVYSEFSHGMDMSSALLGLCKRIEMRDLNFFTTAVLIQRETGGNLTDILEKISVLIRERFQLRNQVSALTAEGRLSGLILVLLPPVLVVLLMFVNPGYESVLFRHPVGQVMSGVAVAFQLLGMLLIRKIVNIKV
ncbi:MAG: type II secretion system F family protein [Desulfobaccales bacterium]